MHSTPRSLPLAFGLSALALSLAFTTGCNKKTAECNSVVEVINKLGASASKEATDANSQAKALKTAADAEDAAAGDIAKLSLGVAEVKKHADGIEKALKAHAAASRELAGLFAALPDAAQMKTIEGKMTAARESVEASEQLLERSCADKDECKSFAQLLKDTPDSATIEGANPAKTKAFQAAVDKWAADVAKVDVKDAELKGALAKLTQGMKDMAASLVQLSTMGGGGDPKHVAVEKAAETSGIAIGKEIDGLNTYCQAP